MDILDTGGDWLQLILAIVASLTVLPVYTGAIRNILGVGIGRIILGAGMWHFVYDYDIILGFLIGCVLELLLSMVAKTSHFSKLAGELRVNSLIVIGIMIIKIVLFW